MEKHQIERLPSEAFRGARDLVYEDVFKLHDLYDKIAFTAPLVLVGHKGVAKSLSLASFANDNEIPIITFDCSEDVRRHHLLGSFVLRGNQTPFVLGPLTTAFEVANETGQCMLVLEELNALSPQCQKLLNPIADFRRRIEVPEAQRVFELRDDAKLWVTGTMNLSVYAGVYDLNEDLKSRFNLYRVGYPTPDQEQVILRRVLGDLDLPTSTIQSAMRLAHETRQGQVEYALSTRDVVQLLRNIQVLDDTPLAYQILTGKFEEEDRTTVGQWIQSITGVKVEV